ncbi:MAG: hypothetical protein QXJ17_07980 [Nitrososphaeria archaeon]
MGNKHMRGQFIVISALILALIVLGLAVNIHFTLTEYQRYAYQDYKEILDNLGSDYRNALTTILAKATQEYNLTADLDPPRNNAFSNFSWWTQAAMHAFSSRGVELEFSLKTTVLQESKDLYGTQMPRLYATDLMKLYWYTPTAISSIYGSVEANISRYGFYGWSKDVLLLLNLTVDVPSISNTRDYTTFNILVHRENFEPVNGLKAANIGVKYFDPSLNSWVTAAIKSVLNNGGGNYTLIVTKYTGSDPIPKEYNKYLAVWVQDSRGIIVESYTYTYIDLVIQENAINQFYPGVEKADEVYALETLINGTTIWFNRKLLSSSSIPPLPLPPVKQFRIYTTVNGKDDPNLVEVPSQVEVWSSDYSYPTLEFANWRKRFKTGDKLVYYINFSKAGVTQQKVRITWLMDADARPPEYLLQFQNLTNLWVVNNGVYRIGFHAGQTALSDPVGIDWNIQVNASDNDPSKYHVEYRLFNYDYYQPAGSLNYKIPWGPGDTQGWTFLQGPVRAVAYRSNDYVLYALPKPGSVVRGELYHTEIVIIPYNVNYFQLFFSATTLSRLNNIYQNVVYLTSFAGTAEDYYPGGPRADRYRLSYGSAQMVDSNLREIGVVNGRFSNTSRVYNIYARTGYNPTTAKSYGYWTTTYSSFRGQATFYDTATISSLKNARTPANPAMFLWTTGNGYKRDIRLDWAYFNPDNMITINRGTNFFYNAAGWYYTPGGSLVPPLQWNGPNWLDEYSSAVSTGDDIPAMYHRMFIEQYHPTIVEVHTG